MIKNALIIFIASTLICSFFTRAEPEKTESELTVIECFDKAGEDLDKQRICSNEYRIREFNKQ